MNQLSPRLNKGHYIFHTSTLDKLPNISSLLTFKEPEGVTHIIRKEDADQLGIEYAQQWSWITLDYQSKLEETGITAAFAGALSKSQIPCNVVAGYFHDHLFIPAANTEIAIEILRKVVIS